MTQLEFTKKQAVDTLKRLCANCQGEIEHICPVRQVTKQIEEIRGVPIIVNDRLYHVMFN